MTDDLLSNLRASSKRWATAITKDANTNLEKFKNLIRVFSRTEDDGDKLIIVTTGENTREDPKYGIKNVARAYEYGSGTRSRSSKTSLRQLGSRGKILITPRPPNKFLVFEWEKVKGDPNFKFDEKGRVMLGKVGHPGVRAANSGKGYIKPAVDKVRAQIRKEVPADVRKAAIGTFRKSFANAK